MGKVQYMLCIVFFITMQYIILSSAIAGRYVTFDVLHNKKLPNYIQRITLVKTVQDCKAYCIKHNNCTGFAISEFERICELYNVTPGSSYIPQSGSVIYVRERGESEGLTRFGEIYLKLVVTRLAKFNAAKEYCESLQGKLAQIESEEMNIVMFELMRDFHVFKAFFGLTDEESEQEWKYTDGSSPPYSNWAYDGTWYRRDRNCAVITREKEEERDGIWRDMECGAPLYFFCSISVY